MESIIDRIKSNRFWKFHGGIHPPEQKFLSNDKPIKSISLPAKITLPLQQHIGTKGDLLVRPGDRVLKGQPLTSSDNPMMVPIHAPTSGTIQKVDYHRLPHPSAMEDLAITLLPDGEDKWVERRPIDDVYSLSRDEILTKISQAGISGMGGAGFPAAMKLSTKPVINYLIINAAECEPYITCDDLLMREESAKIAKGIDILDHLLLPEYILIGIEDNKPEAIAALQHSTQHNEKVHVCVLPTKYPTGGEKQLIQMLTGKEVSHGALPINHGIIMQNVATTFAVAEAVENDTPLIKRVVTVTGQNIQKPQNYWVLLGTPVEHIVKQAGFIKEDNARVIMGGPMMGFTLPDLDIPIIKTSNCILAPSAKEIPHQQHEEECIRCGECAEVCPSSLLPQELQWHAKAKNFDQLEELNLFDCIDCGACAYVCPSHIPLVQYYRVAKAQIKEQKALNFKAEKAKIRFEARKARLEKERIAREEKHKQAAAARKAKMAENSAQAENDKSAVAAALARVRAKKAGQEAPSTENKSAVNDAIARVKARKAAQNQNATEDPNQPNSETAKDRISAAKERALAKAKARQAEKAVENGSENTETNSNKDKIAAAKARAIAKAKAKQAQVDTEVTASPETKVTEPSDKIAAAKARAIAKAKAKKLGNTETTDTDTNENGNVELTDANQSSQQDKVAAAKARAIAKAKAKQKAASTDTAAEAEQTTAEVKPEESTSSEATSPQDKIAAAKARAIAKAKAKKQAQFANEGSEETVEADDKPFDKSDAIAASIAKARESSLSSDDNQETVPVTDKKALIKERIQSLSDETSDEPVSKPEPADKKARIAAAIAKAKAKKQAKETS